MLTLKNDLTCSSYTRSDLCVLCIYPATSAFNEEYQCHHEFDTHDLISVFSVHILPHQRLMKNISAIMGLHIYGITEKLYAINFLNVIDACRLVHGRFPS